MAASERSDHLLRQLEALGASGQLEPGMGPDGGSVMYVYSGGEPLWLIAAPGARLGTSPYDDADIDRWRIRQFATQHLAVVSLADLVTRLPQCAEWAIATQRLLLDWLAIRSHSPVARRHAGRLSRELAAVNVGDLPTSVRSPVALTQAVLRLTAAARARLDARRHGAAAQLAVARETVVCANIAIDPAAAGFAAATPKRARSLATIEWPTVALSTPAFRLLQDGDALVGLANVDPTLAGEDAVLTYRYTPEGVATLELSPKPDPTTGAVTLNTTLDADGRARFPLGRVRAGATITHPIVASLELTVGSRA